MQVVDCLKDLTDSLGSILLSELALLANAIEQLSTCCQLGNNVVFVLRAVSPRRQMLPMACLPLTRTSRGT